VTANWYLKRGDGEVGPGSDEQIRAAFKKNALNLDSLVRQENSQDWVTLKDSGILPPDDANPFLAGTNQQSKSENSTPGAKPLIHKDMFQEKPRYGRKSAPQYATFIERFAAIMIDCFIVMIASVVTLRLGILGQILNIALGFAYLVVLQSEWGYTIGRKVMGIHVEMANRGRPDLQVFVIRYFSSMVSAMILGIGYFMAVTDPQMRTLHDRVAGTIVVKD
jgi:uncharacterized RDD family membrane protein YckC